MVTKIDTSDDIVIKWEGDYSAYGMLLTGDIENLWLPLKTYALHEHDIVSGLVYAQQRWYDPQTGQFISEDPIKDGNNYYAYCSGNPIGMIDPSGLSYEPEYASSYYRWYSSHSSTHHWDGRLKTAEEMSGGGSHGNGFSVDSSAYYGDSRWNGGGATADNYERYMTQNNGGWGFSLKGDSPGERRDDVYKNIKSYNSVLGILFNEIKLLAKFEKMLNDVDVGKINELRGKFNSDKELFGFVIGELKKTELYDDSLGKKAIDRVSELNDNNRIWFEHFDDDDETSAYYFSNDPNLKVVGGYIGVNSKTNINGLLRSFMHEGIHAVQHIEYENAGKNLFYDTTPTKLQNRQGHINVESIAYYYGNKVEHIFNKSMLNSLEFWEGFSAYDFDTIYEKYKNGK